MTAQVLYAESELKGETVKRTPQIGTAGKGPTWHHRCSTVVSRYPENLLNGSILCNVGCADDRGESKHGD